jgi:hypothetical protein
MDESIYTEDHGIAVDLRRTFRKETVIQLPQHILGKFQEKGILAVGHIRDFIRKCILHLFGKFLLVTFIREEAFTRNDLAYEIPIVAAPLTACEFDSTVFVNAVYSAIVSYPCTFAGLETGYFLWQG